MLALMGQQPSTCAYSTFIHGLSIYFAETSHQKAWVNTVRLVHDFSEKIPEDPAEVSDILQKITERNMYDATAWQTDFEPGETQCLLCGEQLGPAVRVPGSNCRAYLLTHLDLIPARSLIRCLNQDCGARHSYRTWKKGKFML